MLKKSATADFCEVSIQDIEPDWARYTSNRSAKQRPGVFQNLQEAAVYRQISGGSLALLTSALPQSGSLHHGVIVPRRQTATEMLSLRFQMLRQWHDSRNMVDIELPDRRHNGIRIGSTTSELAHDLEEVRDLSDRPPILTFSPFWLRARSGLFAQVPVYNHKS